MMLCLLVSMGLLGWWYGREMFWLGQQMGKLEAAREHFEREFAHVQQTQEAADRAERRHLRVVK